MERKLNEDCNEGRATGVIPRSKNLGEAPYATRGLTKYATLRNMRKGTARKDKPFYRMRSLESDN